jgi:hypothetical protein
MIPVAEVQEMATVLVNDNRDVPRTAEQQQVIATALVAQMLAHIYTLLSRPTFKA